MDYIQYQTFKIFLSTLLKKQIIEKTVKNTIIFKIKPGYKIELLSPETMKLLGKSKKDVDKDKNGDAPKLESVEVALLHYNLPSGN